MHVHVEAGIITSPLEIKLTILHSRVLGIAGSSQKRVFGNLALHTGRMWPFR